MSSGRLIVVLLAVAGVVSLIVNDGSEDAGPPEGAVEVSFVYSPEKEELLKPLIEEFNETETDAGGGPAFVESEVVSSGEAERKIASGQLKPIAWSPASSLWGRLVNYETDSVLTPESAPSVVRTPLVIAMWEPMAKALGWPDAQIGFADILALARSPGGWAAVGHPEYGDFKLVHTNPDFSTSGLSAVVAEYYAATGKTKGLVRADISGAAREAVRTIERSIVHYGDTTLFIADRLREEGLGYASAVAMEEATLIDFNQNHGGQPRLAAIYPKEGTFFSDNPYFVLKGKWVSNDERAAADAFASFLAERVTPELAAQSGFRPPNPDEQPVPPVDPSNGVDPAQPKQTLSLPSPEVLAAVRSAWREDRKPANVMLVVDVSGSMLEQKRLEHAKEGLDAFFRQIQPGDYVGLTKFNSEVDELVPIAPFSTNAGVLEGEVASLAPKGGTAFRDATAEAFERVKQVGGDRINAVVVLTDGADTDSKRTLPSVTKELSSQGDSATQVRVFTIGYSADAEGAADALKAIAEASGGQYYEGGTEDIALVYRSISSFF